MVNQSLISYNINSLCTQGLQGLFINLSTTLLWGFISSVPYYRPLTVLSIPSYIFIPPVARKPNLVQFKQ